MKKESKKAPGISRKADPLVRIEALLSESERAFLEELAKRPEYRTRNAALRAVVREAMRIAGN